MLYQLTNSKVREDFLKKGKQFWGVGRFIQAGKLNLRNTDRQNSGECLGGLPDEEKQRNLGEGF